LPGIPFVSFRTRATENLLFEYSAMARDFKTGGFPTLGGHFAPNLLDYVRATVSI
jgi:hypothetical protein